MPEVLLDDVSGLGLGEPTAAVQSLPLPYPAELMPTLGLPINGGVAAAQDQLDQLQGGSRQDQATAKGITQSQNSVWDKLATFGIQNPYGTKKSSTKTTKSTFIGPVQPTATTVPYGKQRLNLGLPDTSNSLNPVLGTDVSMWSSKFSPQGLNPYDAERIKMLDQEHYSYTGADLRVFVEVAGKRSAGKQLVELSTITVSIHREKTPVRACSYINPKAFAYGRRTIAGSIILTQFWMDALLRFLDTTTGDYLYSDKSTKDLSYSKIDQLPPMNFTFLFGDEVGHVSVRRLLGVTFVTDGSVYSINDQMTEQTISYMAMDFTPLQPIDLVGALKDAAKPAQKTPKDVRSQVATSDQIKNPDPLAGIEQTQIPYTLAHPLAELNLGKVTPPPPAPSGQQQLTPDLQSYLNSQRYLNSFGL